MDEISLMTFYEQTFMDEKLNFYGIGFFHEIFVAIEDIFLLGTSHGHHGLH
jgi:hypothetical protein